MVGKIRGSKQGDYIMKIFDVHNVERDMAWLRAQYGNVRYLESSDRVKFALVEIHETIGPAVIKVQVLGLEGGPQVDQPVANHWPDEGLPSLEGGGLKTKWHNRACVQRTNSNGYTGFGIGTGSYIDDLEVGGPHTIWVLSPSYPSDGLAGVGMLGGTNHAGPLFMVFQVVDGSGWLRLLLRRFLLWLLRLLR